MDMRLNFWSNGELSDALREYGERRLRFALGRFVPRIADVHLRFEDVNGPRGGVDKQCRLDVLGLPSWRIQVQGEGTSFYDAIDAAAARAGRSIARLLSRMAETSRQAPATPEVLQ
jgi:ribosome-associated translation inhibitor RaiA